jgi:hypothetical protein
MLRAPIYIACQHSLISFFDTQGPSEIYLLYYVELLNFAIRKFLSSSQTNCAAKLATKDTAHSKAGLKFKTQSSSTGFANISLETKVAGEFGLLALVMQGLPLS